jgi:hypothetical protein
MKTIKKLGLVLSVALAIVLYSCSKDDNGGSSIAAPATGTYINAKINGANFTTVIAGTSSANASIVGTGADSIITVFGTNVGQITGNTFSSSTISILLEGVTGPGTYVVGGDSRNDLLYLTTPNSATAVTQSYQAGDCSGTTGTVTITSLSATQVEGTFSFTAKKAESCDELKTITSGSFRGVFM